MYNNRPSYHTRTSGRFNTPGQFVAAGESASEEAEQPVSTGSRKKNKQQRKQQQEQAQEVPLQNDDVDMKPSQPSTDEDSVTVKTERPAWMKSKLGGVRKISNKERRRRQNETLRRLLTPKNALMVLNEMMPHEQINNQFKVETSQNQFYSKNSQSYCADLNLEGSNYKGYGENKMSARNSAAEQAIRDLIIRKMNKACTVAAADGAPAAEPEEPALPMIQLASFALHKLFAEWEYEGHRVPHFKPGQAVSATPSEAGEAEGGAEGSGAGDLELGEEAPRAPRARKSKGPRSLPATAASMHPSMLLAHMRPQLEYRELDVQGDRPQNMVFTMGVDVDGATYIGKASNKKEARKAAARAACTALFGVQFDVSGNNA